MRLMWPMGLALLATGPTQRPSLSSDNPVTIYALLNDRTNEWCGFNHKDRWQSEIVRLTSLTTSTIQVVNKHPTVVTIFYDDDPGAQDWAAQQTYKLNQAGRLISLETITNVLPGDVSRRETYVSRDGRLVRSSVRYTSLTTKLPLKDKVDWLPTVPVYRTAPALPMSPLIGYSSEVLDGRTMCFAAASKPGAS